MPPYTHTHTPLLLVPKCIHCFLPFPSNTRFRRDDRLMKFFEFNKAFLDAGTSAATKAYQQANNIMRAAEEQVRAAAASSGGKCCIDKYEQQQQRHPGVSVVLISASNDDDDDKCEKVIIDHS